MPLMRRSYGGDAAAVKPCLDAVEEAFAQNPAAMFALAAPLAGDDQEHPVALGGGTRDEARGGAIGFVLPHAVKVDDRVDRETTPSHLPGPSRIPSIEGRKPGQRFRRCRLWRFDHREHGPGGGWGFKSGFGKGFAARHRFDAASDTVPQRSLVG